MRTSRNRVPAALTEAAVTLRLSLHNYDKDLKGGQDMSLQHSFHHSTQMETTTVSAGKQQKSSIRAMSKNTHFVCFSGGNDIIVRIINIFI